MPVHHYINLEVASDLWNIGIIAYMFVSKVKVQSGI
jgi:hypothetical protein